jgi:hypothetical protein
MAWCDGDYCHDELWKNENGQTVTIERQSKDWATGKSTVQFWYQQAAYTMDMEEFEKEFTHVEELSDYVIKYVIDGVRKEFDTPQEAARFLLRYCNTEDASIEELIYSCEKNYRIGFTMCSYGFWSGWWAHGESMLKEIAAGKIPEACASSYTKYSKAVKEGAKID